MRETSTINGQRLSSAAGSTKLELATTKRFRVLRERAGVGSATSVLLVSASIALEDLLLCERDQSTEEVTDKLHAALEKLGFCLIRVSANSRAGQVVHQLKESLEYEIFPTTTLDALDDDRVVNAAGLGTSNVLYFSEKNIPMYRLGYECCADGGGSLLGTTTTPIREVFRVGMKQPDDAPWVNEHARRTWLAAVGLMRHVTDKALDLLVQRKRNNNIAQPGSMESTRLCSTSIPTRHKRPYSGVETWHKQDSEYFTSSELRDRPGDYSMLYAMHYFPHRFLPDETDDPMSSQDRIAVKAHVDPGLLVLEPFFCETSCGLQVWDRCCEKWLDCDGPNSPFRLEDGCTHYMLMFAGKALTNATGIPATLHRVVECSTHRKTVIYEQKYEEFFPQPTFD